jgi:hypothetical protein
VSIFVPTLLVLSCAAVARGDAIYTNDCEDATIEIKGENE